LVDGLVRDLFREDAVAHYRDLLDYAEPELKTLEDPLAWVDALTTEALSAPKVLELVETAAPAERPKAALRSQNRRNQPKKRTLT
jgi:hypothetical protein